MLNDLHRDALTEIINIGVGQAGNALNTMLAMHVELSVPEIKVLEPEDVQQELAPLDKSSLATVILRFSGPVPGKAALLFPPESALNLVTLLVQEEPGDTDLDSIRSEALTEIGNIVLNSVLGNFANILSMDLEYSLPDFMFETSVHDLLQQEGGEGHSIILAKAHFKVREHSIAGDILLLFGINSMTELSSMLDMLVKKQAGE